MREADLPQSTHASTSEKPPGFEAARHFDPGINDGGPGLQLRHAEAERLALGDHLSDNCRGTLVNADHRPESLLSLSG